MLSETHPNALWLSELYRGGAAITQDPTLSEEERLARQQQHVNEVMKRMSPDFVIHTGGVRLAATGGMGFLRRYTKRRESLADANVEPLGFDQILADDYYGIVHGNFRTSRGDRIWTRVGMGAWRFVDGVAVEHWELADGYTWDEFYLAGDPTPFTGSAEEFWTRGV
ncbi:putative SnoaL-like aldol condensation-catalyzing enzyme [Catenuloplanes atrovinosus]|uniref:SnoaL-like aldol condensation-catalyzing enzyme n=1 Tax=Catenuloplanes atrovinosus TaxID=137266 RepID=A0AAE3YRA5_9ACTN|nr:putative SnoaL-like aldol condensation-catalyzing enzyme [Catenuloplanes atrovinosus]